VRWLFRLLSKLEQDRLGYTLGAARNLLAAVFAGLIPAALKRVVPIWLYATHYPVSLVQGFVVSNLQRKLCYSVGEMAPSTNLHEMMLRLVHTILVVVSLFQLTIMIDLFFV
jgi:hypothetical protein